MVPEKQALKDEFSALALSLKLLDSKALNDPAFRGKENKGSPCQDVATT